jgi:hypothetical protein
MVAFGVHVDLGAGVADDKHRLDIGALFECLVDGALQLQRLAGAVAIVGGDDEFAVGVLDAAGDGFGGETAEHHRMHRADARARQHRHRGFGDHRHVQRDAVALRHAEPDQRVRHAAGFGMEFAVADAAHRGLRVIAFPDDGDGIGVLRQMAVEAVDADVEDTVLEPFDVDGVPAPVAHFRGRGDPVEPADLVAPKAIRIAQRARVVGGILRRGGARRGERGVGDGKQMIGVGHVGASPRGTRHVLSRAVRVG